MKRIIVNVICIAALAGALQSCVSSKNVAYFRDIPDSIKVRSLQTSEYKEPVIQSDDILAVTIQTIDPQTSTPVNQPVSTPAVGYSTVSPVSAPLISGYLVDKAGTISIPMLGSVKVAGLTTSEARDTIRRQAEQYYVSPTVQVRFANFKITVIGEVVRPATYTIPNERVSVVDAIGYAGDLTIYGKRENILLIRDSLGSKQFVRLNLNSTDIFKSPYFYLRQNDVIYVEPNDAKIATTDAARTRTYAILGSALSVLIIVASRILK